jgi:phosphate transport system substrate-binding protein
VEGGADCAGTDSAFKTEELTGAALTRCDKDAGIVEIPAYISPIAVAFNLDGVTSLNLDAAIIAKIFKGEIAKWNDPAIAEANKGITLPDLKITPVHRSDESGTTKNFTDYLNKVAKDVWTFEAAEEWPIQGGEGAEKTSGVKETISGAKGAIGYLDASQVGELGSVAVKVGETYTKFTPEGAAKAVSASDLDTAGRGANDLAYKLNRETTEAGAYPVVLVSYLVACQKYADPKVGEAVKAYFSYVTSQEGQQAAAQQAGSAPLQGEPGLAQQVKKAVDSIDAAS